MIRPIVIAGCILTFASEAWSQPQIQVVNAASFQPGLPAGGSLATAFCPILLLPNIKPGTYIAPSSSPLPFELEGIQVNVNNTNAPILAVVIPPPDQSAYAQVNFQVPQERNTSLSIAGGAGAPGVLTCGGAILQPLPALPWGGFYSIGNGYAAAQHASDYSLVTPENPARAGETIIAYADDFFPVWPPTPIGFPTPQQPLFQILSPHFTIIRGPGDLYLQDYPQPDFMGNSFTHTPALQIGFQGLAPGQVGLEQINFVVPANQQSGDWALFFNVGSCPDGTGNRCSVFGSSSPYVKLPVR